MSEEELELLDYTFNLAIGECYSDEIDEISKLQKKLKRLNNIINELEKYINEEYIYDELGMKIFDASKLHDKLQELKGSEKE